MSSLPPYNPRLGDRAVWLCPLPDGGGLPADLPLDDARWGAAVVDREAAAAEVRQRLPNVEVRVLASPAEVAVPERSWLLVAAHPAWCEVVLRQLMGMPPGTATFALAPGAVSIVQLLPDRGLLLSLNDGRALDGLPREARRPALAAEEDVEQHGQDDAEENPGGQR